MLGQILGDLRYAVAAKLPASTTVAKTFMLVSVSIGHYYQLMVINLFQNSGFINWKEVNIVFLIDFCDI